MEYIEETATLTFILLVSGAALGFAWYQYFFMPPQPVRPGGEKPGELDPTTAAVFFTFLVMFSIPYCIWKIAEIWSHGYVLSIRSEERAFYSSDFKENQTFHIGPLRNVSGKTLVLRLRWRPQLRDMSKIKSFFLQAISEEPKEVTFTVTLTRCRAEEEVELSRHKIVQKISASTSRNKPPEYDAWREIVFHIPDSSPENSLKISVQMTPQLQVDVNTAERLWLELSTGLRLRDVKNNDFAHAANIETAEIRVL